jgi:tetraacyldisaccharide 4'-kinase
MDDGFQSAKLTIDYALLVIDTTRGIGNGYIVPAGPVRAPMRQQLRYATALLKVGEGNAADKIVRMAARAAKPYFTASLKVCGENDLARRRVLAFAGIADPEKFFRTVESLRAEIVVRKSFGDHEHLTDDEIDDLLETAAKDDLQIVTTSKDFVRLCGHHGKAEQLAAKCRVIEVEMTFADHLAPGLIIDRAIAACRERRLREAVKKI